VCCVVHTTCSLYAQLYIGTAGCTCMQCNMMVLQLPSRLVCSPFLFSVSAKAFQVDMSICIQTCRQYAGWLVVGGWLQLFCSSGVSKPELLTSVTGIYGKNLLFDYLRCNPGR
jgi:hypothetical protein